MQTDFSRSLDLLPLDFPDDPAPSGSAMDGVLEAYRQQGYETGYNRALNDVLADFLLFTQRQLRTSSAAGRETLGNALRQFELQLEQTLTHRSGRAEQFVEGGLGI